MPAAIPAQERSSYAPDVLQGAAGYAVHFVRRLANDDGRPTADDRRARRRRPPPSKPAPLQQLCRAPRRRSSQQSSRTHCRPPRRQQPYRQPAAQRPSRPPRLQSCQRQPRQQRSRLPRLRLYRQPSHPQMPRRQTRQPRRLRSRKGQQHRRRLARPLDPQAQAAALLPELRGDLSRAGGLEPLYDRCDDRPRRADDRRPAAARIHKPRLGAAERAVLSSLPEPGRLRRAARCDGPGGGWPDARSCL